MKKNKEKESKKIEDSKKEETNKEEQKYSKILIMYDEYQHSRQQIYDKILLLLKTIESHNGDKNAKYSIYLQKTKSELSYFTIKNKYYTCDLHFEIFSLTQLKKINLKLYEGIIIYLDQVSIKNKIFENCDFGNDFQCGIILLDDVRDDLFNLPEFSNFIGNSLDKHFEVICGCEDLNTYDEEDGPGALNMSLNSVSWNNVINNNEPKEKAKNQETKEPKKATKNDYEKINEEDQLDYLFDKIKQIKLMNQSMKVSDKERRENAEKAINMLMSALHIEESEEEDSEDEKKK